MATRREFVLGAIALAAVGAGGAEASEGDMTIGAANAPVHLIEYASLTCPHCAEFHASNWHALKAEFIDTGRVRFTLCEMATQPANVAVGMFQLARCGNANAEEYFRRVAILYGQQRAILSTGSGAGVRDALVALGAAWGLSRQQVMAAFQDPAGVQRVQNSMRAAFDAGVTGTPAFKLNGAFVTDHAFHTPDGMRRILAAT